MHRHAMKNVYAVILSIFLLATSPFSSIATVVGRGHQQATTDSCLRAAAHLALRALREGGADGGSNFAFSPLSLRAALGLLATGASGGTLEEVLAFLGYGGGEGIHALHDDTARVIGSLFRGGGDGGPVTSFVNGLWVDQGLSLNESFKEIAATVHRAQSTSVDFQNKAEEIREGINSWVKEATHGLIQDLLPPGSVGQLTELVLANALYFKGQWEEPFYDSSTFYSDFHLLDGTSVRAPFMYSQRDRYVASFDGFKVLRLPYLQQDGAGRGEGSRFSMYVFLPDERDGLAGLVERVASDPSFVSRHLPAGGWKKVPVRSFQLPKFRVSRGSDAADALGELGLRRLLSPEGAEMGGLATGGARLGVMSVLHKAAVEVEEKGTEAAAAATAMILCGSSMMPTPRVEVEFVADHPFLFFVMEDVSGQVVFSGHVVNPLVE